MPVWSWIQDPLRYVDVDLFGIVLEDAGRTCKILVDGSDSWVDKADIEPVY